MARTEDHVLKSLPVTRQQLVSCVDNNKNCLTILRAPWAMVTYPHWSHCAQYYKLIFEVLRIATCSAICTNQAHRDAVCGALVRFLGNIVPFLTAGYYFIIYIEWAKIDLWAFTVFFEAMILK